MIIKNPFEVESLSKLSIAEMEQELDEIMECSGFIIPPRAAALQEELTKRRRYKIDRSSLYGPISGSYFSISELARQAADRESAELTKLLSAPIPKFIPNMMGMIDEFVAQHLAVTRGYDELLRFDGTATEWFNHQYLQECQHPATEPKVVRKLVTLGLLPPPHGVDPIDYEIGREMSVAHARQYVESIAVVTPAATASRLVRDHIFDNEIEFMYPTAFKPIDAVIRLTTPVAESREITFDVLKKRGGELGHKFTNFEFTTVAAFADEA